jgi:hypothetical protein
MTKGKAGVRSLFGPVIIGHKKKKVFRGDKFIRVVDKPAEIPISNHNHGLSDADRSLAPDMCISNTIASLMQRRGSGGVEEHHLLPGGPTRNYSFGTIHEEEGEEQPNGIVDGMTKNENEFEFELMTKENNSAIRIPHQGVEENMSWKISKDFSFRHATHEDKIEVWDTDMMSAPASPVALLRVNRTTKNINENKIITFSTPSAVTRASDEDEEGGGESELRVGILEGSKLKRPDFLVSSDTKFWSSETSMASPRSVLDIGCHPLPLKETVDSNFTPRRSNAAASVKNSRRGDITFDLVSSPNLSQLPPLTRQGSLPSKGRVNRFLSRDSIDVIQSSHPHDFDPEIIKYESSDDESMTASPELDVTLSTPLAAISANDEDQDEESDLLVEVLEGSDLKRPIFLVPSATQFWKGKTYVASWKKKVMSASDDDEDGESELRVEMLERSDLKRPVFLVSSATQFWKGKTSVASMKNKAIRASDEDDEEDGESELRLEVLEGSNLKRPVYLVSSATQFWRGKTSITPRK